MEPRTFPLGLTTIHRGEEASNDKVLGSLSADVRGARRRSRSTGEESMSFDEPAHHPS